MLPPGKTWIEFAVFKAFIIDLPLLGRGKQRGMRYRSYNWQMNHPKLFSD
jgi:hypothetical protein